jgi:hypothetical protein
MTKLLCLFLPALFAVSPALCDDYVVRDANGRIVATISDTANGHTVRDGNSKIIGRIEPTVTGKIVRDEDSRIIGRIESGTSRPRK